MSGTGKDSRGRFTAGNTFSNGINGNHRRESLLVFQANMPPKEVLKVLNGIKKAAYEGNLKAMIYLMDRCLGKMEETLTLKEDLQSNPEELRELFITTYGYNQNPPVN